MIVLIIIFCVLFSVALITLYKKVDFRAEQLVSVSNKHFKSRQEILQMISNLDSQIKSLAGKVQEIETNLYMINEATNIADEFNKEASEILEKLEKAFPDDIILGTKELLERINKQAMTNQVIEEEIAEEELEDWHEESDKLENEGREILNKIEEMITEEEFEKDLDKAAKEYVD